MPDRQIARPLNRADRQTGHGNGWTQRGGAAAVGSIPTQGRAEGASDWPHSRRHIARFILVGLYTGTRAGAMCSPALAPPVGRGWVGLDAGLSYRRAAGAVETKKRQPTVRLPPRSVARMRRWRRLGISTHAVVEFNGKPVRKISKTFRGARADAKLSPDVVPHRCAIPRSHEPRRAMLPSATFPGNALVPRHSDFDRLH